MSLVAYQSALAELVADGHEPGRDDLDERDRRRLAGIAPRGVATMRMLYMSWRLTKVLSLLPLTVKALGEERTAALLRAFWRTRKATSLHFVEECLDFAAFLRTSVDHPPPCFGEVLAFEAARLELRDEQSRGRVPEARHVRFGCDPTRLLAVLQDGGDLASIPCADVTLRGELDLDGTERWTIVGGLRAVAD